MTVYAATHTSGGYPVSLEENIIHIIGIVAAEGLLILRIYAFWKCNKKLLIGLLAYAIATLAAAATIELDPVNLMPGTTPSGNTGFEASRNSALIYSLLMTYEFVLLSLIIYKKWTSYREISDSMVNKVYQDGVFYIACIAFVTMMNLIFSAALPITYSDLLDLLQIVLHSVLASRILFGLRESNKRVHDASLPLTMSSFHCTSRSGVMVDSAT
ncbi:hypothetical protein BJ138DRAFT_1122540 [Hygrophoropsis aurantiaca]|uniref:Uncharacterized protein n=1 Tax=Hygrophoropsis aurantiaca TaxID=72124 RepID=A0ACB8ART5_9AGAM|nr:hypothetical protein BJ138DRAFT_1122540 [Hygrophoropsis aurantiaca]